MVRIINYFIYRSEWCRNDVWIIIWKYNDIKKWGLKICDVFSCYGLCLDCENFSL